MIKPSEKCEYISGLSLVCKHLMNLRLHIMKLLGNCGNLFAHYLIEHDMVLSIEGTFCLQYLRSVIWNFSPKIFFTTSAIAKVLTCPWPWTQLCTPAPDSWADSHTPDLASLYSLLSAATVEFLHNNLNVILVCTSFVVWHSLLPWRKNVS